MIDYCNGIIEEIGDHKLIVNLGTIGLHVNAPQTHQFEKNQHAKLYLYLHWNAEQGPSMYGFQTPLERSVFCTIIGCSGIGPKIALTILNDLGAQSFLHAVQTQDENVLSQINGIGKKKAEHIIVALKHKVHSLIETHALEFTDNKELHHFHDISQALLSLNYSRTEINSALDYVKKNTKAKSPNATFDYLLRQALAYLSKQL
jgi:Holliday junction DNA helicase RuvA